MSTVIETSDKKYAVFIQPNGAAFATRHGEYWRELVGDKFVTTLALDLQEARAQLAACEQNVDAYEAQFAKSNVTINELLEAVATLKATVASMTKNTQTGKLP
jgi:hypothetical protein